MSCPKIISPQSYLTTHYITTQTLQNTFQKYLTHPTKNMIKIKNKREIKRCLQQHAQNNITIKQATNQLKTTPKRSKQPSPNTKPPTPHQQ